MEITPFNRLHTAQYSIVTKAHLITLLRQSKILVQNCKIYTSLAFNDIIIGGGSEYCYKVWYGKTRMVKKSFRI